MRDVGYHVERAREELDRAYRASDQRVAAAHLKLSALHMSQVKHADEACGGSACSLKA
jgi:hypothetical protein